MSEPAEFAAMDRERLRRLRSRGLEIRHVFDVGASNGAWSVQVAEDFPEARFDLFEPMIDRVPEYARVMEHTLAGHPYFHLHKVALDERSGDAKFLLYPDNPAGSTGLNLRDLPEGATRLEVATMTLDGAIDRFQLGVPQLIKMDTQGCELAILKGATRALPQVDVLLLETWLIRGYGETTPLFLEVADWLADFHFYPYDFSDGWRDPDGNPVAQDVFFLNARSHVSRLQQEVVGHPPEPPTELPVAVPVAPPRNWFRRLLSRS